MFSPLSTVRSLHCRPHLPVVPCRTFFEISNKKSTHLSCHVERANCDRRPDLITGRARLRVRVRVCACVCVRVRACACVCDRQPDLITGRARLRVRACVRACVRVLRDHTRACLRACARTAGQRETTRRRAHCTVTPTPTPTHRRTGNLFSCHKRLPRSVACDPKRALGQGRPLAMAAEGGGHTQSQEIKVPTLWHRAMEAQPPASRTREHHA
jgi:hypothetical protein